MASPSTIIKTSSSLLLTLPGKRSWNLQCLRVSALCPWKNCPSLIHDLDASVCGDIISITGHVITQTNEFRNVTRQSDEQNWTQDGSPSLAPSLTDSADDIESLLTTICSPPDMCVSGTNQPTCPESPADSSDKADTKSWRESLSYSGNTVCW